MKNRKTTFENWSAADSAELYGINEWGAGYFSVNEQGDVLISPYPGKASANLRDIVEGIRERGMNMPVLLRISNILDSQIRLLHSCFRDAIKTSGYQGEYKGVFPIKVNQQQEVIEDITEFGREFNHGLEAGSKAELIAALGTLDNKQACIVCNGYKDEEFIDLGLSAIKLGFCCILVVEMPSELNMIIERSRALNIKPLIGVRMKLSTRASDGCDGSH